MEIISIYGGLSSAPVETNTNVITHLTKYYESHETFWYPQIHFIYGCRKYSVLRAKHLTHVWKRTQLRSQRNENQ
jgi:hypothetical protein